jgi:hypothetical protein
MRNGFPSSFFIPQQNKRKKKPDLYECLGEKKQTDLSPSPAAYEQVYDTIQFKLDQKLSTIPPAV